VPAELAADPRPDAAFSGVTCVVTGGLGFIGSNVVHRLVTAGARVRVADALVSTHGADRRNLDGVDGVEVIVADIGDPLVGDALDGVDVIFNVAGQVSHTASMADPLHDLHHNTISHARFLEQVRTIRPSARIVQTSTRQVYGRVDRLPVDETAAAHPVDVNGVAKLAGEQLHLVYAHAHGMAISSLRLTNVYGPRQRLTSDELGFLPVFIRRALMGDELRLFGDGSQRRDCLHVDDVVDALFATATCDAAVGDVFNVGHDRDHSLAEIAATLVELAGTGTSGRTSDVVTTPWPADHSRIDIGSFRTDSGHIARTVGWKATTDLRDGLAATLAFYRDRPWYLSSI
jgi:UDP-glucose 4-epimerase